MNRSIEVQFKDERKPYRVEAVTGRGEPTVDYPDGMVRVTDCYGDSVAFPRADVLAVHVRVFPQGGW